MPFSLLKTVGGSMDVWLCTAQILYNWQYYYVTIIIVCVCDLVTFFFFAQATLDW